MPEQHLIFGYGTLQHKRDFHTFDGQLMRGGAKYLGDGVLDDHMIARVPCYGTMFAGVVQHPGGYVQGEIYRVDGQLLSILDSRENINANPPVYKRELKRMKNAKGQPKDVWVYTVDHNPLTVRKHLTHTWPVAGIDLNFYVDEIRTHRPLVGR